MRASRDAQTSQDHRQRPHLPCHEPWSQTARPVLFGRRVCRLPWGAGRSRATIRHAAAGLCRHAKPLAPRRMAWPRRRSRALHGMDHRRARAALASLSPVRGHWDDLPRSVQGHPRQRRPAPGQGLSLRGTQPGAGWARGLGRGVALEQRFAARPGTGATHGGLADSPPGALERVARHRGAAPRDRTGPTGDSIHHATRAARVEGRGRDAAWLEPRGAPARPAAEASGPGPVCSGVGGGAAPASASRCSPLSPPPLNPTSGKYTRPNFRRPLTPYVAARWRCR